jgi:hypothetical protein
MKRVHLRPVHGGMVLGLFVLVCGGGACSSGASSAKSPDTEGTSSAPLADPSGGSGAGAELASPDRRAALASESTREQTIQTLLEEYVEAAKHGSATPEAKAFIDRYAGPLAEAYAEGHGALGEKLRLDLMTKLVSFKDTRTVPAHSKALQVYADAHTGVDEAIWACQAAQRLTDERLAAPLMLAFDNIDMADDDGRRLGRHLVEAMLNNKSPKWTGRLKARLGEALERPSRFDDTPAVKRFQNRLYWQTSAARLLGELGAADVARDLGRVLVDSSKREVHPDAELALAKLGAPATKLAESLLAGEDAELVALARASRKDLSAAHIYYATEWLSRFGRPSSVTKLHAAWDGTQDAQSRVLIARALTYLPKSEESLERFKKAYAGSSLKLTLPAGESALEALVENAPYFFEPSLTPWLMERAGSVRGVGPRKGDVQRAIVVAVAQLVTPADVAAANKVSQQYGGRTGTPAFDRSAELAGKCQKDAACYMKALLAVGGTSDDDVTVAHKAMTMIGAFGGASERDALIAHLPRLNDVRLTTTAVRAIGHLTGSNASSHLIAALEAGLKARGDLTDPASAAAALPIHLLIYRLRAA